jgi:hypothetical protein
MRKSKGYWSKERCLEEALKYNNRSEFQKKSKQAYAASFNNKWLDEVCSHMTRLINPNGFWNKETCYKEMIKYNNIKDFKTKEPVAYASNITNKWFNLDDFFIRQIYPNNYWTKEKCLEEALKYNSRNDFYKNSRKAYFASTRNKWMDDVCLHMFKTGNKYKRCIYSYEFKDNNVYVGLTYDINNRNNRHLIDKRSCVYKHMEKTGLNPILKQLTDYIDVNEASKIEEIKRKEYENHGWIILNKVKCGGIGGITTKWTKEKCLEESLKYSRKVDFQRNSGSAYQTSYKNGWLEEICNHMKNKQN